MYEPPYTDGSRAFYLRCDIDTMDYHFHAGKYVRAMREHGHRTYRIWPSGQAFAFVVGIYRKYLRPAKRYRRANKVKAKQ